MKWDQITIVDEGKRLTGPAARSFVLKKYSDCVNTKLKSVIVLKRQACFRYFSSGSGQAKGAESITDDLTVGAILRAWFGESLELPSSAKPEAPKLAQVQRRKPNVVRREPPILRMFLDADRNGAVDADPPNHSKWTWGATGYGAILMAVTREWTGTDVVVERVPLEFDWQNGLADDWQAKLSVDHPERIRIYRGNAANSELLLGAGQLPGKFAPLPGIAGPLDLKADVTISGDLAGQRRVRLWMDAPDFPETGTEADCLVKLTLTYEDKYLKGTQQALLRIAPWIMASDLDPTATVYMRDIKDEDLTAVIPRVDFRLQETQQRAKAVNAVATYLTAQIGASAAVHRQKLASNSNEKGFMRDVMMFGYTSSPSQNRVVLLHELEAESPLMTLPKTLAQVDPSLASIQRPDGLAIGDRAGQDNGGNYLVTPKRPGYEYGRIIYGDSAEGGLCHAGPFLKAQRIQKPIVLDSTWLDVGHVDEFLSFVPDYSATANPEKPFKVLIASPRLAYLILWATARQLQYGDGADGDLALTIAQQTNQAYIGKVLPYNSAELRRDTRFAVMGDSADPDLPASIRFSTVLDPAPANPVGADGKIVFMSTYVHLPRDLERLWPGQNTRGIRFTSDGITFVLTRNMVQSSYVEIRKDIRLYLETVADDWTAALEVIQPKLNAARATLKTELGLEDSDFIEVPIVVRRTPGEKIFFETPDSINLLALNDWTARTCNCLVPKPFGPVLNGEYLFERYLGAQLLALNVTYTFINDLPFSLNHGEIHCGTNQRHVPLLNPSWWRQKQPDAS